jgi:hypothetical protein
MAMTKPELLEMGFEPQPVLRAIREKCLDCSGGSPTEVADCLVKNCALYPFRMARNPWRAEATEAQREVSRRNAARSFSAVRGTESGATGPPMGSRGPVKPEALYRRGGAGNPVENSDG